MNILYVATVPGFQVANDVRVFENAGHKVIVLNTWRDEWDHLQTYTEFKQVINLYFNPFLKPINKALFPYSKILLSKIPKIKKFLLKLIKKEEIDIVYGSWDSGALIETNIIKNIILENSLNIPVVFRYLMLPAGLSKIQIILEKIFIRNKINNLDGIIWPTNAAQIYARRELNLIKPKTIIFPPYLSKYYYPSRRFIRFSEHDGELHIIFIGSSDFSNKERDVSHYIKVITNAGIHLHMAKIKPDKVANNLIRNNKYLHFFEPMPMINLTEFMTSFDACIIFYNYYKNSCMDRFKNVIPNRFIWAVPAGIPIILYSPHGELESCENFVKEHQYGFILKDLRELKTYLHNKELMENLYINIHWKSLDLQYEKHFFELENFLNQFVR